LSDLSAKKSETTIYGISLVKIPGLEPTNKFPRKPPCCHISKTGSKRLSIINFPIRSLPLPAQPIIDGRARLFIASVTAVKGLVIASTLKLE